MMSETLSLSAVARALASAAEAPAFRLIRARLADLGVGDVALAGMLRRVSTATRGQNEVVRLRARVQREEPDVPAGAVERYMLLRVALGALDGIAALPVPEGVKQL